jgi:hypothetical protein
MDIQVGYASEVGLGKSSQNNGGRSMASAGLEYTIAPASWAGAGFTLSNNQTSKVTSADLGLRFKQQDTSVSLGYRLVDLSKAQPQGKPDAYHNLATAEFSISF